GSHVPAAEHEDGAEEDAHARGAVLGAALGREDGKEEDAEAERPGEERADDDVVRSGPVAEHAHEDAAEDAGDEEPYEDVQPENGRCERTREGDVTERVAGEHLGAKDDEVAHEAAGDADEAPGDERVAHELVGEHQTASAATRPTVSGR